ncbi:MAG TPA: hypothetical protein VMR21_14190 [Vicinamibacteria bacterium]|nr:hypothetical protein [Vicinamibacteria bacterium]
MAVTSQDRFGPDTKAARLPSKPPHLLRFTIMQTDEAQPLLAEVSEIARMLHALRTKVEQDGLGE